MELNKTKRWFYLLTGLSVVFILTLGSWWLYLFFKLANKLQEYQLSAVDGNLIQMLQWEGLTFFILLLTLAFALFYVFYQDQIKTKSLQAFFASLTHELKTPLASIRLQSQVINDLIEKTQTAPAEKEKLNKYALRLQEDSIRLENELDRHLQLSRIERGAPLNTTHIELVHFLKKELKKYPEIQYKITTIKEDEEVFVQVDEYAFSMIIRNLIENTLRHSESHKIIIDLTQNPTHIIISYNDQGKTFNGSINELGQLFYKYNSPKGSGIGLYLIKKLLKKMGGRLDIQAKDNLIFNLYLKRGLDE